jgi:hypothetical protein
MPIVVDQHHLDADLDSEFYLMLIRILIFTMKKKIVDPDPDPSFKKANIIDFGLTSAN